LVLCDECKAPVRDCIRRTLQLDPTAKIGIKEWCKYMKALTGDEGCAVWVKRLSDGHAYECKRPALFWTKTPWGCSCTRRVCRKHSRSRKVAENGCVCPKRLPMVNRGGPSGGEPSPWQENAIRHLEGDGE